MKPLSELLKHYIEKSNYTIYSLSYASKVNRTTLQKALTGERPISAENLNKILPFLNLTFAEKKELDQALLISRIGEITYQKHVYIKELLERIEIVDVAKNSNTGLPFSPLSSSIKDTQTIKGMFNIIKTICQISSYQMETESEPFLYTIAPFENRFFLDLYEQFQLPFYQKLDIRHITPFVKTTRDNEDDTLHNLRILSSLFPFALSNPKNCALYYCYEAGTVSELETIPFTYFIVCNHHVFLLSCDCENALILPDSAVSIYLQYFKQILQNSLPLIDNVDTEAYLSTFITCATNAKQFHSIEEQPCITAFVDQNIIQDSINKQLPLDSQQFLTNMLLTQTANLKKMFNCITVFTKKGLDNFVQNGIIQQIPSQLYHPLSIKNRILILNRMLQANQSGSFCFHLIKEESFHPKIEIVTYDTDSMLLCYQNAETSMMQTCLIKEPNTILAFNDFIQNLSNHNLVCDVEETSDILLQQIQSLKQLPPPPEHTFLTSVGAQSFVGKH